MALPEGMVAMVRNVQDASGGLCVTLVEGNRQYTLLPNSAVPYHLQTSKTGCPPPVPPNPAPKPQVVTYSDAEVQERPRSAYDSSAQAVDGHYASVYKVAHCNLHPTSPPVELTEFPPQRPALYPGRENFVVGGCGSGVSNPSQQHNLRSGVCWPDRGQARYHRPSRKVDPFAKSLRNYPCMSPERSAEVVERLVTYSNMRNSRNFQQSLKSLSPTVDRYQQNDSRMARPQRAEVYPEDSPTRDKWSYEDREKKYPTRYDVRIHNEKLKENHRNVSVYPSTYPARQTVRETFNHLPPEYNIPELNARNSVNMETQASVPMVSREMTTTPKPQPVVRDAAVLVSTSTGSSSSDADCRPGKHKHVINSKSISIQTKASDVVLRKKSVQTCFSSVNVGIKKVRHKRRSKSQEEIKIYDDLDEDVGEIIRDAATNSEVHSLRNKLKKLKKHNSEGVKVKIGKSDTDKLLCSEKSLKEFTRELSNDLLSKIKRQNIFIQPTDTYRANLSQLCRRDHEQNYLDGIVIDWLDDIPIKSRDYLGRRVVKEQILKTVGDKVRNLVINKLKYSEASTKADIIDILEDIPIDVSGHNRRLFLNRLVTELVTKAKDVLACKESKRQWRKTPSFCSYIQPTHDEIKEFIGNEIIDFKRKFRLVICNETLKIIIHELAIILMDSLETIRSGKIRDVIDEILTVLAEFLTISEFQAIYFAHNLVYNLFHQSNAPKRQPFDFLQNNLNFQQKASNNTDFPIENEKEYDNKPVVYDYAKQIASEVNEWLSNINGVSDLNLNARLVVVNDLTGDIVDRQKYLERNSSRSYAESDELEHLKYQIFKWVNKALGEENTDTIAQAPELMERIRNVPITTLAKSQQKTSKSTPNNSCTKKDALILRQEQNTARRYSSPDGFQRCNGNQQRRGSCPGSLNAGNRSNGSSRPTSAVPAAAQNQSIKQLNEEYDAYVKDWVQRVPIAATNAQDEAIAEKARLGLYIGVWKAITKLKMNPDTLDNPYHYQDGLDDELEVLLQCLPQSPEFKAQKHTLKSELIEKTMGVNQRVANVAGVSSYKQQLVDNVNNNLPQTRIDYTGKDPNRLYEEWEKMMLAELFILFHRYKIDDKVKAMAYKKKLMRQVEKMIENIKVTQNKELQDIDQATYKDEILAALEEVPMPSDETINQEAEEIMISLEIEQWLTDLPLMPNEREIVILEKRVYQDLLARKLYDIDKHCDPNLRSKLLAQEIRRFLERLPLRPEEKQNMNFMTEELLNRLSNINNDIVAVGTARRSVTFMDGYEYDEFSRNMPHCSSFDANRPRAQINDSSYLIVDGTRVRDGQPVVRNQTQNSESEQYFTIEGTTGPRNVPCCGPLPQNGARGGSLDRQERMPSQCQIQGMEQSQYPIPEDNQLPLSEQSQLHIPEQSQLLIPRRSQLHIPERSQLQIPEQSQYPIAEEDQYAIPNRRPFPACCVPRNSVDTGSNGEVVPSYTNTPNQATDQLTNQSWSRPATPQRQSYDPNLLYPPPVDINPTAMRPQTPRQSLADNGTDPIPPTHDNGNLADCCRSPRRSSAPPSYRPTSEHHQPPNLLQDHNTNQYNSPIGYSTPQNAPPAPKLRRNAEKRDSARRRLSFEDTDYDSDAEYRCRCLEKVWRCRGRQPVCEMRGYLPCEDYVPCLMRMRRPYY